MFLIANKLVSLNQIKYSLQAGVTACFDWNLLLWPSKQGFCAGSADTCKKNNKKKNKHKKTRINIKASIQVSTQYDIYKAVRNR